MAIDIHATGCACPPNFCAHFVEPPGDCINRLTGDVRTQACPVCHPDGIGATWHQDGQCLRCRHYEGKARPVRPQPPPPPSRIQLALAEMRRNWPFRRR